MTSQYADAAETILREAGEPLPYKELTQRALDRGLIPGSGKTPWNTMSSRTSEDSRFVRVRRGLIGLRSQPGEGIDPASAVKATKRQREHSFTRSSVVRAVSKAGQVSLPADLKRRWGVDKVIVVDKNTYLTIYPMPDDPIAAVAGSLAGRGRYNSDELRAIGREEDRREEERFEALRGR